MKSNHKVVTHGQPQVPKRVELGCEAQLGSSLKQEDTFEGVSHFLVKVSGEVIRVLHKQRKKERCIDSKPACILYFKISLGGVLRRTHCFLRAAAGVDVFDWRHGEVRLDQFQQRDVIGQCLL